MTGFLGERNLHLSAYMHVFLSVVMFLEIIDKENTEQKENRVTALKIIIEGKKRRL